MKAELYEADVRQNNAAPQTRLRTLLIEDNAGDARLIQLMLADAEADLFAVDRVDRLSKALERLANGGVDVVLSDLSLPDSQGLETFRRLHRHSPQTPIIVLSGLNDTNTAVHAVHEGAQDYLIKGQVDGRLLARAIRYAIERKGMTEQLHRYAAELREKNAQLEADFNMAREIQQIFLPNQYPTFPHSVAPNQSALRFAHRYLPAAAVGGDFFDIFAINDSTAGIFVCDVMGHGMRAALITAIMRGLIEELMPVAADPGKFLMEINRSLRAILKQTREPFLATAFYLVADAATNEWPFASAGHPSPFCLRRRTGVVELLKDHDPRHGPALGLFEKASYPNCRCRVEQGDLVVLYTDGIYEITNSEGEEFGQERLYAAIQQRVQQRADVLFEELLREGQQFSDSEEFEDDVCLVSVEFAGSGAQRA